MNTPPRLDQQLGFVLYAASRRMMQAYQPLLSPLGLTFPQFLVMTVLWQDDGSTMKTIGDRLLLDSGTLTPLLKRLEVAGLVSRRRKPDDARSVEVWLSDSGRALAERTGQRLSPLTGAEQALLPALQGLLRQLEQGLSHS